MDRRTALAVPYYIVRTPLTIFDKTVVRWLPERSGTRRAYDKTTSVIDAFAGRGPGGAAPSGRPAQLSDALSPPETSETDTSKLPVKAPGKSLLPQQPTEDAPPPRTRRSATPAKKAAAVDETAAAPGEKAPAKKAAPKQAAAKKTAAKKAARKSAPKPDTRANRSLSSIALDLAETEAIAEARENQAEQRVDAELSGDTGNDDSPGNS